MTSLIYELFSLHINRERNSHADRLSKDGLNLEQGIWQVMEFQDDTSYEYYHRPFI